MAKPKIVSAQEWQRERGDLLTAEKEATRALDALAARRRRLPMVRFGNDYVFDTPARPQDAARPVRGPGPARRLPVHGQRPGRLLPGLHRVHQQRRPAWPALAEYGVSWVTVSNMPLAQIEAYKARMGWTLPFVSSRGTSFADDCGAGRGFMLSVFLRDGTEVYRTYSTTSRGVDRLMFVNNILDLSPYGRQEDWEDSPPGWPQHPTYG